MSDTETAQAGSTSPDFSVATAACPSGSKIVYGYSTGPFGRFPQDTESFEPETNSFVVRFNADGSDTTVTRTANAVCVG